MSERSNSCLCSPSWLPEAHQKNALIGATLLTLVLIAGIHVTNAPLQNPVATRGIDLPAAGREPGGGRGGSGLMGAGRETLGDLFKVRGLTHPHPDPPLEGE